MVLLERTPALGSVADYLSSATVGNGRLVFIGGEAGVGKTTFVDRVVSDAGPAVRIAYGACDGSSTPAPLGPLREMLPALPGDVWPPDADRAEVFTRLSEVLGRPGTPYLLVVEDAHWADDATLDLLRHLARRVHRLRALVLVTFRTEEAVGSHALRVLFGDVANASGVRRVDLNPLTGRPLARRIRRFRAEPDRYLASLGGPLPFMRRLRQIDDEIETLTIRLGQAYADRKDDASWRRLAERWDFGEVNDLIERHNRYYPIEARLPMDPRTRDYVKVGGRSYRREPLDAQWILDRFPV